MITHIKHHPARGPSYASGGEPGETIVWWTCDKTNCGFYGTWDDRPHREDGRPHEDPEDGDAAYCEDCVPGEDGSNE